MRAQVAEATAYYNELLETRFLDSTRDMMLAAVERHVIAEEGRSLCTAMRPYLVTESTYRAALRSADLIYEGIRRAAEALAGDEALRRKVGIPDYLDRIIELDRERGACAYSVISRLDSFLTPEGAIMVIEANTDPLVAVIAEVDLVFRSMPIAKAFAKRYPFHSSSLYDLSLNALYDNHSKQSGAGTPTIAVIRTDTASVSQRGGFYRWLGYAAARGCNVLLAKPEEFEYKGSGLRVDGTVVDSVALSTAWEYVLDPPDSWRPLLKAIQDGAVRSLNGLSRAVLSTYKNTFEMLTDPDYYGLFDREVLAALNRHVPWTRVVRDRATQYRGKDVDLLPFIADHQEELVLKPSGGSGAVGVVLGWKCTPEVWKNTIRRSHHQSYVVQERVRCVDVEEFHVLRNQSVCVQSLNADFNPYIWNGERADGCNVRLSPTEIQNLVAGGSIGAVWILDEDEPAK
jgi:hypothetical protein